MDITRKQKRLQTWTIHASEKGIPEDTRQEFLGLLKSYRNALARCWEDETPAEQDLQKLTDLERQLEAVHAASRYISRLGAAQKSD